MRRIVESEAIPRVIDNTPSGWTDRVLELKKGEIDESSGI